MTAARGVRNRNPGNIEASTWAQRQPGFAGSDGRFAIFDTFVNGIAAQYRLLQSYRRNRGLTTLRGVVNTWAPAQENDVSAYLRHVSELTGFGYDEELADDPETYRSVAWAMACHENGADQIGREIGDWPFLQAIAVVFPESASRDSATTPGNVDASPPSTSRPSPAPTTKEQPMVAPAIILSAAWPFIKAALPKLIQFAGEAAPTLIRMFGTDGSKITERNAKAVEVVMGAAMSAAGTKTVEETIGKLAADPVALQAYQAALLDDMERLMGIVARGEEMDESSRDRAAVRAKEDTWDSLQYLVSRTERVMYVALAMEAAALGAAFYFDIGDAYIGAVAALFVSTITSVVEEWRRPRSYRMGSSSGSKASGDAVRKIAEGR